MQITRNKGIPTATAIFSKAPGHASISFQINFNRSWLSLQAKYQQNCGHCLELFRRGWV